MKKTLLKIVSGLLAFSLTFAMVNPVSVSAKTDKKTEKDKTVSNTNSAKKMKKYSEKYLDFSLRILKKNIKNNENMLISPLSIFYAMGMVTNGAKRNTLKEMEDTLGMTKEEMNEYLNAYMMSLALDKLSSDNRVKFHLANSIWIKDDKNFEVNKKFLKQNSNIYKAEVYKTDFNETALNKINSWIDKNTKGLIKKALDKIGEDAVMYLVNALVFDGKWEHVYNKENLENELFTAYSGKKKKVKMMYSKEYRYISDKNTSGFMKYYEGGKYAFVALLPDKNTDIKKYIKALNAKKVKKLLAKAEMKTVHAVLPAFEYDYKVELKDVFKSMGMKDAFDSSKADFTGIGKMRNGFNIFINRILHKTHIAVDELGTKAGAVTIVEMNKESMIIEDIKNVRLDRPFVYMIVDTKTNSPVFIGNVMDFK